MGPRIREDTGGGGRRSNVASAAIPILIGLLLFIGQPDDVFVWLLGIFHQRSNVGTIPVLDIHDARFIFPLEIS